LKSTLLEIAESFRGTSFTSALQCPICGADSKIAHAASNIHPEKQFEFAFRICRYCAHGWIDPMPTQGLLNYLYAHGSNSVIGVGWSDSEVSSLTIPERLVCEKELASPEKEPTYFELGVGKGLLYKQFVNAGWQCSGVELGEWGRIFPGVRGDFKDLPHSYRADVLVALDVLEHVSDPLVTLAELRRVAGPAARLYAAMPNRVSLRALVARRRWRMLRPLGHVNYWSKDSINLAFSKAGFQITQLYKTDLSEQRPIRTIRSAVNAAVEKFGLGDQWIVVARAV
jgi:SAM-dependent methyltransferase